MAYQKDQFFYKKLLNIFTYKKTPIPRLARLVLLEFAKHCDQDGWGEASKDEIGKPLHVHKNNISRFTRGFEIKKIMTKIKQYHKRSQNMKPNKFQIHLDILLELTMNQDGSFSIDHKPYIYQKTPATIEENHCSNNVTSHHGDATPSHHGDVVKLRSRSRATSKTKLEHLKDIVQTEQRLNDFFEPNMVSFTNEIWFEEFWEAYPRKQDKQKARNVWLRKKLDAKIDMIKLDLLKRMTNDVQWLSSKEFIPLPSTYLNGERWNDEIIEIGSTPKKQEKFNSANYLTDKVRKIYEKESRESNVFDVTRHLLAKMDS